MSRAFEQIAHRSTPIGDISLRRRLEPTLQIDVYEVKLGDEYLMTSLFTAGEEALAHLGLGAMSGDHLDVLVGGLGLGHTAHAALSDPRVATLHVVDALAEVIRWHDEHLVPLGAELAADPRCHLVHGDFFAMMADEVRLPDGRTHYDVILVDIDHTPSHHLDAGHADFYQPIGLARVRDRLRAGGVFALWSDDPPDHEFLDVLRGVFPTTEAEVVTFPNIHTGGDAAVTVYVCPMT
ncbi:MAG: spermidine synthase [Ilumatobacteraceae bacterium]